MSAPSLKVVVVFHSRSGNTFRLARAIVTGAEHVPGASVTLRRVSELTDERELMAHEHTGKAFAEIRPIACATPADVLASDVVIFGCPTRFGSISAELKYFIDSLGPYWSRGELRDKVGAAFTSASTYHGGHELTLMSLLAAMMHYGMFVVTPGYIDPIYDLAGAPYGATATTKPARVRSQPNADDIVAAKFLGQRAAIAAIDLCVVPTLTFERLFAFLVLGHGRRQLLWFEVTQHPTAEWLARQITEAFPWASAPAYLVRDNDRGYGNAFRSRVRAMGIRDRPISPGSPWQNPYVERLIGTIRRECLDGIWS